MPHCATSNLATSQRPIAQGIYTLGNDRVFDQIVALLNSIDANVGSHMPVIIFPYDDQLERLQQEVDGRPNVQIFADDEAIARWDAFVLQVWQQHPVAQVQWQQDNGFRVHRHGVHRRLCGLDGPFQRYLYIDADTLVLNNLDAIFAPLETHDWVTYDFQHRDPSHVFNLESPKLFECLDREKIRANIFCSGLYASHSGLFSPEDCDRLLSYLSDGEAELLYCNAPDQTLLNYMVMRSNCSVYNLAHQLPLDQVTGCCVTSPHFTPRDHTLYDGDMALTYLHYIGISSGVFARLCLGENLAIPYRDLFLHYRYLHAPDQRPRFTGAVKPYNPPPSLGTKVLRKLGLVAVS